METNQNNQNQAKIKYLTITIIFDGSALNRDDKIGGNITAFKKLTIYKQIYSYMSKYAIRHYLFQTLIKKYNWRTDASLIPSGTGEKKVIQFDITKSDILTHEELDVFGYMYTEETYTRKAPLGITKAISLLPYVGDMALYANHDLVHRIRRQNNENEDNTNIQPNIFNKEENNSLYKVSFTIDSDVLGKDVWWVKEVEDNKNSSQLIIKIGDKNKTVPYTFKKENNNIDEYKVQNGTISVEKIKNDLFKVTFKTDNQITKKRILNILECLKNGLYAQSSGEANTIVPLLFISATVKVPAPIFHPYIDVSIDASKDNPNKVKVIGIGDGLKNEFVEKVFIEGTERIPIDDQIKNNKEKVVNSWIDFLKEAGLSDC